MAAGVEADRVVHVRAALAAEAVVVTAFDDWRREITPERPEASEPPRLSHVAYAAVLIVCAIIAITVLVLTPGL